MRIALNYNAFSCHFFNCITGCRSNIVSPLLCWKFVLWSPAKTQSSNECVHDKIRNSYRADSQTEEEKKDQGGSKSAWMPANITNTNKLSYKIAKHRAVLYVCQ
ncbi:hypothetical protein AWC38_SpisGene14040 [Stylophora pistillata]|uniref:Uncharacterized protein n=1 Tax=Stylophora pistillata TaxID=50429 RepID=A0A2B4RV50_STYPI|nr:hypothetical protein AWC38_SpisGene14040 [Stylophora pistillata]